MISITTRTRERKKELWQQAVHLIQQRIPINVFRIFTTTAQVKRCLAFAVFVKKLVKVLKKQNSEFGVRSGEQLTKLKII